VKNNVGPKLGRGFIGLGLFMISGTFAAMLSLLPFVIVVIIDGIVAYRQ
jgi:hypothetical protein